MIHFKKPTLKEFIVWFVCAIQGASILGLCFIFFPSPFIHVASYALNDTAGRYYPIINTIEIYPRSNDNIAENILVSMHELCHFIWFKKLDDQQRSEWDLIHNSTNTFVTSYAKTNSHEDFADSCAFYLSSESVWRKAYLFSGELGQEKYDYMVAEVKPLI